MNCTSGTCPDPDRCAEVGRCVLGKHWQQGELRPRQRVSTRKIRRLRPAPPETPKRAEFHPDRIAEVRAWGGARWGWWRIVASWLLFLLVIFAAAVVVAVLRGMA